MLRNLSDPVQMLLQMAPRGGKPAGASYEPEDVYQVIKSAKDHLEKRQPWPGRLPAWAAAELERLEATLGDELRKSQGHKFLRKEKAEGGTNYYYRDPKTGAEHKKFVPGEGERERKEIDPSTKEAARRGIERATGKKMIRLDPQALASKAKEAAVAVSRGLEKMPGGASLTDPSGRSWSKKEDGSWESGGVSRGQEQLVEEMAQQAGGQAGQDAVSKDKARVGLYLSMAAFVEGAVPGRDPHWDARMSLLKEHIDKLQVSGEPGADAAQATPAPASLEQKRAALAQEKQRRREAAEHELLDQQLELMKQAAESAQEKSKAKK